MPKAGPEQPTINRRQYRRLDQIFPVEFRFLGAQGQPCSGWHQAFTQDIGRGGLCLTVNHVSGDEALLIGDGKAVVSLNINLPPGPSAVRAVGRIAWSQKTKEEPFVQYLVGVTYDEIRDEDNKRILRHVALRRAAKGLGVVFSLLLSAGLAAAGITSVALRWDREKLLAKVSSSLEVQRFLRQHRDDLLAQAQGMEFLLSQADRKIATLEAKLATIGQADRRAIDGFEETLNILKNRRQVLQRDLSGLLEKTSRVEGDMIEADRQASFLEERMLGHLSDWLLTHQNNRTGLVASFEGEEDTRDLAFTYDQALAATVFVLTGHAGPAKKIFNFYAKAKKIDGGAAANAYYASTGDVAESVAHAGPNIWLGLAVLQYSHRTGDPRYLSVARSVSRWLDTVKDSEGGLRGSRGISGYSTEHNLDAYAFYRMFGELTREAFYRRQAERILAWLGRNAFSMIGAPVIKRGKGDATIATDTYAWSIAAIGPAELRKMGMEPDQIMDFAIDNCSVTVDYERPQGGIVKVSGFDFAKHANLARGGVVSCEWTAQMILALKIAAEYYAAEGQAEKARRYSRLANEYIGELGKMVLTSASPVGQGAFCLPYASHALADTGHGWRTPKGDRTGSVAATAYAILAMKDFNPLQLNGRDKKTP